MSTTTSPASTTATDEHAVDADTARAYEIDARAKKIHAALQRGELKKSPAERVKDGALWKSAHKEATHQIRRERVKARTKEVARNTATGAYAEAKSAAYRNRKQLAPWLLAAPYAAVGETAALLAEQSTANPIGVSAVCAACAVGGSVVAWKKKLRKRTPSKFTAKLQAGLGLLCGWDAAMPLVHGTGQAGMWLAFAGGVSYMGLSWWREHDHPIPLAGDVAALDLPTENPGERKVEATATDKAFAEQLITDYAEFVAGMGTLPGSTLTRPLRIEYGWAFLLTLVRGKQKLIDLRAAKETIAAALNLDATSISFDRDTRPGATHQTVVMTVITDEISNAYDGPRIVREGGDIFIEVGPHEDGLGAARFHVLSDQLTAEEIADGQRPRGSMNGGFALGTKGSGKSRLMEEVAVGLRKLGIEIWYLDPQGGKSSPALMAEADWPLAGVHGTKGAYTNVTDLWRAVKAACEVREAEGGSVEQGFQHTRPRPAIMVMIDECHGVFQAENPETGNSFGQDFAELDRIMRKNGVGLFGASQAITQDTFGRGNAAAVLRDGMCAVNVFLMSYGGKNLRLAPGYDDQPCGSLPVNQGLGYSPKGDRPQTRWQARYTPDFQPWLAKYPRATLDERIQKRIGQTYLRRFEQHAENEAGREAWLAAIDAHEGDASTLPAFGEDTDEDTKPGNQSGVVASLLSPHQRRLRAAGITEMAATALLTNAEQRVLDVLREEPGHTPTSLGRSLGIKSQPAGRQLRSLAAKGYATRADDGRYTAKN